MTDANGPASGGGSGMGMGFSETFVWFMHLANNSLIVYALGYV